MEVDYEQPRAALPYSLDMPCGSAAAFGGLHLHAGALGPEPALEVLALRVPERVPSGAFLVPFSLVCLESTQNKPYHWRLPTWLHP